MQAPIVPPLARRRREGVHDHGIAVPSSPDPTNRNRVVFRYAAGATTRAAPPLAKVAPDTPLPDETEGAIVGTVDDDAGLQALVVSIGGATGRLDGGTYHITWSLGRGRQPIESNDVLARFGWQMLPEPIPIRLIPARF